jgi:hypothetical protein
MKDRLSNMAGSIKAFVENPLTNLVKGIALLLIGLSEASKTFHEDLAHGQVRVGHGLVIIGVFSILSALPHFLEGLEASIRFVDQQGKGKAQPGSSAVHGGPERENVP